MFQSLTDLHEENKAALFIIICVCVLKWPLKQVYIQWNVYGLPV